MFDAGTLTFQEFAMNEPLPLATIQNAVLEFLRGRDDGVVFGAQAVNAYVSEPRMTQDVDLLSTRPRELADELREHLSQQFHIAVRVREIGEGRGYRLSEFVVRPSGGSWYVSISREDAANFRLKAELRTFFAGGTYATKSSTAA